MREMTYKKFIIGRELCKIFTSLSRLSVKSVKANSNPADETSKEIQTDSGVFTGQYQ